MNSRVHTQSAHSLHGDGFIPSLPHCSDHSIWRLDFHVSCFPEVSTFQPFVATPTRCPATRPNLSRCDTIPMLSDIPFWQHAARHHFLHHSDTSTTTSPAKCDQSVHSRTIDHPHLQPSRNRPLPTRRAAKGTTMSPSDEICCSYSPLIGFDMLWHWALVVN